MGKSLPRRCMCKNLLGWERLARSVEGVRCV